MRTDRAAIRVFEVMEESAEKRREKLRAMREEASLAGNDEGRGPSVANPPDTPGLPLLSDIQQPPKSPSPRFEFYTDPLAAYSGSQRNKKSRNSFGSSFGGAASREAPASPFTPPSSFSPSKHSSHHQPTLRGRPQSGMATGPDHFSSNMNPCPNANHNATSHGNFYPSPISSGGFSTPSSICHSSPGSSSYGSRSAPYNHNGNIYMNSPAPSNYNGGRGRYSTQSPQSHVGGMENNAQSHGSNRSWGSFNQTPGSSSRGTPRILGGRGVYWSQGSFSESATPPQSFAKRSMLEDPWQDLVPVRIESVAFRLDSCSVTGSRDWLPKSANRYGTSSTTQGLSVSTSGPSLAESLAASFADAVAE